MVAAITRTTTTARGVDASAVAVIDNKNKNSSNSNSSNSNGSSYQQTVETFDSPITRKQTYTSLPRPVQCARCSEVAYCRVTHDLGQVIKVEYLCHACCGGDSDGSGAAANAG